jgi:hypothetical protein
MSVSIYQVSAPEIVRLLGNVKNILQKAVAHADAKKIDHNALLQARLYPDMYALLKQVQVISDQAKGSCARLAGVTPPVFEDTEKTFPELFARIDKTIAFINSLKPEQFEGVEDRAIEVKFPNTTLKFTGLSYLNTFVFPNVYFHSSMVYAILRHNGVEVGKGDFLGAIQ